VNFLMAAELLGRHQERISASAGEGAGWITRGRTLNAVLHIATGRLSMPFPAARDLSLNITGPKRVAHSLAARK
jgi:hypothetical protein